MTNDEIVLLVKIELLKARQQGIPIDMAEYGVALVGDVYELDKPDCAVCAIGAVLLDEFRRSPSNDVPNNFAKLIGRSLTFARGFSDGTLPRGQRGRFYRLTGQLENDEGYHQGRIVRDWADQEGLTPHD